MNKDLDYYYKHAISINEFLSIYYGKVEFMDKKLVHENVKSLFPFISRGSFEDIVENPELVYTGKVVLVKDSNKKCIPYIVNNRIDIKESLNDREKLIVELVSAIDKLIKNSNKSLIILENNDSISSNIIGSTSRDINIVDDEIVRINNEGGILIKNTEDIYTFKYLISKFKNLNLASYSKNNSMANDLSKEKDIISINITDHGRVYITYKGEVSEKYDLIDIRNFLLKVYSPREEEVINSDLNSQELDYLMDYELEHLKKRYRKDGNFKMYFKTKVELDRRRKAAKKEISKYKKEREKIKIKKMEEE